MARDLTNKPGRASFAPRRGLVAWPQPRPRPAQSLGAFSVPRWQGPARWPRFPRECARPRRYVLRQERHARLKPAKCLFPMGELLIADFSRLVRVVCPERFRYFDLGSPR